MASSTLQALVLRAHDHFAGSSRWAYLAVLTLAASHALVVMPFIADSRLVSETSLQRTRLAAVESSLGELHEALEAVRQETSSTVTPALERLIEDLENDLERLDVTRRQIAERAAAEREALQAAGESPAEGAPAGVTRPPPAAQSAVRPFLIEDPDRIADLRQAETPDQLLAALAPLVDELVTKPLFFDLQGSWKDEALPRLRARLDAAASALPRLRSRFPEARSQWQALSGSLSALATAAGRLTFEPPARLHWWARTASDGIELGLTPEVMDEIRRPRRLADLETAADRAVESYSEIVGLVAQAQRALGDPDDGAFGGLDVAAVATFPLFIGLLLGATVVGRSQRLRELGLTLQLAIEHGDPAALRLWLWSVVQWSTSAGASAATAWRACLLQTLLGYFLAMSWIALAAVQLRQLDGDHQRLLIYTVAGASIVLGAVVHRLLVARRAIMGLDGAEAGGEERDDRVPTGPSGEATGEYPPQRPAGVGDRDPERDGEFLEVRPLRR